VAEGAPLLREYTLIAYRRLRPHIRPKPFTMFCPQCAPPLSRCEQYGSALSSFCCADRIVASYSRHGFDCIKIDDRIYDD
jgi:hypothetical protein